MLSTKKIYLSDDDHDDVEFFKLAVAEICGGCSLTVSYNGEELLAQLENCGDDRPDIIFLDVNMPKINGLEALKSLKQFSGFENIPVIVYSTTTNDTFINDAYSLGANHYFVKPFNFRELREQVRTLLEIDWKQHILPTELSKFVLRTA